MNEEPTDVVADVQRVMYTIKALHDWTLNDCPRRGAQGEFIVHVPVRRGWLVELPNPGYRCALCDTSMITVWALAREVIT